MLACCLVLTTYRSWIEHDKAERDAEQDNLSNNYYIEYLVKRFYDCNRLVMVGNNSFQLLNRFAYQFCINCFR